MPQIVVDISQLCADPVRTGIQRVVRCLIRELPSLLEVSFVRFDREARAFRRLDGLTLDMLIQSASWDVAAQDVAHLVQHRTSTNNLLHLEKGAILFIPEVFYDLDRLALVADLRKRLSIVIALIVFDFAPYFNPNIFRVPRGGSDFFFPFLRLTAAADARAFISQPVQDAFQKRIIRSTARPPHDIVAVLGANGLPASDGSRTEERDAILCIGSFDGKKNQDLVYAAFVNSKLSGARFKLKMLGKLPKDLPPQFRSIVEPAAQVEIIDGPTDMEISRAYDTALVSVFVGTDEGYGLPAVESLYHGVPIIAHSGLPSIQGVEPGIVRLNAVTIDTLTATFDLLADGAARDRLLADVALVRLPTWRDFAMRINEWLKHLSSSIPAQVTEQTT